MTGYMHTMLALCVLNDYVSFYKVIFIIYLPLKSLQSRSDAEPTTTQAAVHVNYRELTECATTVLSKDRYWLSIYEHIHSF